MWSPSMNHVDIAIMHWLNSLVGKSASFDQGILWLSYVHFIKGAIFVSIFWWYWFRTTDAATTQQTGQHVLSTLGPSLIAIVERRVLALPGPFRVRPRSPPA